MCPSLSSSRSRAEWKAPTDDENTAPTLLRLLRCRHCGRATLISSGPCERLLIPRAGHFLPREAPKAVVGAVETRLA